MPVLASLVLSFLMTFYEPLLASTLETHPGRVLLHLMLVAMRAVDISTPEAVLAELVPSATQTAIAEARHTVATAVGTRDGMVD